MKTCAAFLLAAGVAAVLTACAPLPEVTPASKPAPDPRTLSTPGCPADARDLPAGALYGRWEARIEGQAGPAVVQLHKHPDYNGVQGSVARSGQREARLAGDIDSDGALSLDESQDGRTISATWSAPLRVGSCGTTFEGSWRNAADDSVHAFTLQKTGN